VQPLEEDHQAAGLLGEGVVIEGEEAADVDEAVLLGGDRAPVGDGAELAEDVGDDRLA
jgi:hypothetical protein